ncbi:MAG: heme o synthase [candidate division WOR-3 bacterium]|nr:heme o synthase [candidate division WOR-3 bacterium]MDW8150713.1 heme o synthase [candidate division WOR-3 bacterium]
MIKDYINIIKPSISLWVSITAFSGSLIAQDSLDIAKSLLISLFVFLSAGGASVLNNYFDRELDKSMERTKNRPIPSGRVSPKFAVVYGILLSLIGLFGIYYFSIKAFILDLIAIISYSFLYTFLKRRHSISLIVGSIPGALPPSIGYVAIRNEFDITAFILFSILFLWQPAHFIYLSIFLKKDYSSVNIPVISVVYGEKYAKFLSFIYSISLIPITIILFFVGRFSNAFFIFILFINFLWLFANSLYYKNLLREKAMFLLSNFYVLLIFLTMALDRVIVRDAPQKVRDRIVEPNVKVEIFAQNLEIPWELAFFNRNKAIVSERVGRIRLIKDGKLVDKPYYSFNDVKHVGEGGLLGIAIRDSFIYAYYTYEDRGKIFNKVVRLKDRGDSAIFDKVILDKIPGAMYHNGGRIKFGPDGYLYITTGDIFQGNLAQDLNSLAGKILRVDMDGKIPKDNPFKNSPIYSYGHRNPQGLAWHSKTKTLYSSEHGPSGEFGLTGYDRVNKIIKGYNYGWPKIVGAVDNTIIVWKETTPPSGMDFLGDSLFIATLASKCLIMVEIKNNLVKNIERWFCNKYGRIRSVVVFEGYIYFLTSNRDGRGIPYENDDKIYRFKL